MDASIDRKRVLFIRHLPSCLKNDEKEHLLKYFGAKEVRVMSNNCRLKNTAFATFENENEAKKAISRLHQVEILDCILSVEYAKTFHLNLATKLTVDKQNEPELEKDQRDPNEGAENLQSKNVKECRNVLPPIAPHFGLNYPANPGLKYLYPAPNSDILINICSALLTVPKLYTQLLHLMNKMNLVPPFTPAATVPQMLVDHIRVLHNFSHEGEDHRSSVLSAEVLQEPDMLDVIEMSESESEYESDEQDSVFIKSMDVDVPERVLKARKRRPGTAHHKPNKKRRLKELFTANTDTKVSSNKTKDKDIGEVFDEKMILTKKSIDIKKLSSIQVAVSDEETKTEKPMSALVEYSDSKPKDTSAFGKFAPASDPYVEMTDTGQAGEDTVLKDYITLKQLDAGRLSSKEIATSAVYHNYNHGEPTCRLYIKNLSKRVTEKDLTFIFGRFVNFSNEEEKNMFDVRLMTQGRMKGQAFIGLPTIESASKALKATNGYQLINKPMVVQFARSAKPK